MTRCLIVVDYQNEYVTGAHGFDEAKKLECLILAKVKAYEATNDHIIYLLDAHFDECLQKLNLAGFNMKANMKQDEPHALYGKVFSHYKSSDYNDVTLIYKDTYGSSDLMEHLLKSHAYETIELVGVVSYMCVLANAIIAKTAQLAANIVVCENHVAGPDVKLHQASIEILKQAWKIKTE